ncbi:protease pro-enzyme activation domain-containing protein [Kitasatospora sp. NPDC059571]|uniref:S53 family peptidase n=1 Tax=Kitasatospora sp. NPDC059571 TaxID=3346871 RepID=UPI00369537D0
MRIHRTALAVVAATLLATTAGTGSAHASSGGSRAVLEGSRPAYAVPGQDLGAVPPSQVLTARLYLGSRDPAGLSAFLRSVTDPAGHDHGRFLSPEQYRQRFALTPAQRRTVTRWLTSTGLTVTADTDHYVEVSGPEAAMDKALGTAIHRYRTAWGPLQAPAQSASVPAAVAGSVVALDGLSAPAAAHPASAPATGPQAAARAAAARAAAPRADTGTTCSAYFGEKPATGLPPAYGGTVPFTTCPYTPAQLRRAYGAATPGATGKGRTVAIVGAYGSPVMAADADRFARATGDRPLRPGQYQEQVDPAHWQVGSSCAPPSAWAGEQALDVETVHGYAPDAAIRYVGANSCLDADLMAAEASVIDHRSADIITNSWAEIIHSQPGHLTPGLVAAWDMLFQQAAAEGIGVYFAAGDCGDSSPQAAESGLNCDAKTTAAQADFPSGDPWVTSVGATTLATDRNGDYAWETSMGDAVSIRPEGTSPWAPLPGVFTFGGGGGPSDFPQPWYQRGRVPAGRSGTTARRDTPDVSLEGDGAVPVLIGYTVDGTFQLMGFGGTSAASPGFAAIQADAEEETGRPIGFANPLLYALGRAGVFHDVTDRPAGGPTAVVQDLGAAAGDLRYLLYTVGQDYGLHAAPGYDEATGLGSPNAAYLRWFRSHG